MRDCVVVGCGRSGTSLAAGLLESAGYDCGSYLLAPTDSDPTGFFEAREVNRINELLLAPYDDVLLRRDGYSRPLRHGERWLAVLPAGVEVEADAAPELREAMAAALPGSPYCCKDTRFGYTLPAWRTLFAEALFVCVFRHPLATAASIARAVRYGDLRVDTSAAIDIWSAVYERVLERHRSEGEWLFVHYEQLLDGTGVERLAGALGAPLDGRLADPALHRSRPGGSVPAATVAMYHELCSAAGHTP
jgi:hypothetical protein